MPILVTLESAEHNDGDNDDIFNRINLQWLEANTTQEMREEVTSVHISLLEGSIPPLNLFPVLDSDDSTAETSKFEVFNEHALLADLPQRTRRGIYTDVPRTFYEFEDKCPKVAAQLADRAMKSSAMAALCRLLCVACKYYGMGYCQGSVMNVKTNK